MKEAVRDNRERYTLCSCQLLPEAVPTQTPGRQPALGLGQELHRPAPQGLFRGSTEPEVGGGGSTIGRRLNADPFREGRRKWVHRPAGPAKPRAAPTSPPPGARLARRRQPGHAPTATAHLLGAGLRAARLPAAQQLPQLVCGGGRVPAAAPAAL